jgi:heme exporter protein D
MSYRDYVIAAYAVFAVFLLWDWLAPKLQLRAALRVARQRAARQRAQHQPARGTQQDLER